MKKFGRNRPLLIILALSLGLHAFSIQRDLPFFVESDEPIFVGLATNLIATGGWNPGWFGNPGSTIVYPLTLLYRAWFALTANGAVFQADPNILQALTADITPFYIIGRILSATYHFLSLPPLYWIGKQLFNRRTALAATLLATLYPSVMWHASVIRSDSAGLLFGVLTIAAILFFMQRASYQRLIWVALALGLAGASRYFMVTLVPALIYAIVMQAGSWPKRLKMIAFVGTLALLTFAASSPYFFLDYETAYSNVILEARSEHAGADGLSPLGNLRWYWTVALPGSMGWPLVALALVGLIAAAITARSDRRVVVIFIVTFFAAVCSSPLHWARWIIQIMPLLGLMAVYAGDSLLAAIAAWSKRPQLRSALVFTALAAMLVLAPAQDLTSWILQQQLDNTRVLARDWLIENTEPTSHIALEWYTAPLGGLAYRVTVSPSLSDNSLQFYEDVGAEYLMTSTGRHFRFYKEADTFVDEVAFYDSLLEETELLAMFAPSETVRGDTIRIFRLQQK